MNQAAIDIGSNTILLLIMNEKHETLEFEARVTSLGKNLDKNKAFEEQSMKDSFEALAEYSQICAGYDVPFNKVRITATEASRVASNAPEFYQKVHDKLGATVEIITGDQEASFAAKGVVMMESETSLEDIVVLMDIGGGSTELIKVQTKPFQILESVSIPLGSVRVSDWIERGIWDSKKQELISSYQFENYKVEGLIGVAGTMTSLINIVKDNKNFEFIGFDQTKIQTDDFFQLMDNMSSYSPDDFLKKYPYLGKRSFAIWGGYQVCKFICEQINPKYLNISFNGLVHGSLLSISN